MNVKSNKKAKVQKAIEISDAKISFISLVDKPANLRPFLLTKAEEPGNVAFQSFGRILKVDEETHYVTGIAYEPMVEDSHGDFMTEEEIVKAAYWFAKNGDKVDLQHSFEPIEGCTVVENWVAKSEMTIGEETVTKGTWLVTVEVTDANVWKSIIDGEITGFSIGGVGSYSTEDVNLDKSDDIQKEEECNMGKTVAKNTAQKSDDSEKGLFKRFAAKMGFDVVEKGAVAEEIERRNKASAFWNAWYAFQSLVCHEHWDYFSDSWVTEFEADPEKWNEAVADLTEALLAIRETDDIVKTLTAAPAMDTTIEKAGKKMSATNKTKLDKIKEEFDSFYKEFDEQQEEEDPDDKKDSDDEGGTKVAKDNSSADGAGTTKEEEEMKPDEIKKMVGEEVAAAVAKALGGGENGTKTEGTAETTAGEAATATEAKAVVEPVTKKDIAKMIEDAVVKALGDDEDDDDEDAIAKSGEEPLSADAIAKMIEDAVSEVKKAHGLPSNLNGESGNGSVQKAEPHYMTGIL